MPNMAVDLGITSARIGWRQGVGQARDDVTHSAPLSAVETLPKFAPSSGFKKMARGSGGADSRMLTGCVSPVHAITTQFRADLADIALAGEIKF